MNKLFVLVGPSAAGKTLISNCLVYRDMDKLKNLLHEDDNNRLSMSENLKIIQTALHTLAFKKIITSTSRKPRDLETHGVDYYFYNYNSFKEKVDNGDFLEFVENFGNYYGTCLASIRTSLDSGNSVIVLDDRGATKMKELLGPQAVTVYLDVPVDVMEKRMNLRNDDSKSLLARTTNLHIINYKYKADFIINASNSIDLVLLDLLEIINMTIHK